jgi:hypothetical protein
MDAVCELRFSIYFLPVYFIEVDTIISQPKASKAGTLSGSCTGPQRTIGHSGTNVAQSMLGS